MHVTFLAHHIIFDGSPLSIFGEVYKLLRRHNVKISKEKQSHYRPGQALRFPEE
jgi:hypothetical protein